MAEIRSRVTLEQIIRKSILTAMVLFFAGHFAYDGYVGYPKKNLEQAVRDLDPKPKDDLTFDRAITRRATEWVTEEVPLSEVIAKLGEPGWRNQRGAELRYFGPAFVLKLSVTGGRIAEVVREPASYKTELDLTIQKLLALILTLIGVPLLIHFIRVLTYSAHLTDRGLKLGGKPLVPFDAMVSMDADRYKKKGQLDIDYRLDEAAGTLRLDDYWIREFKPIVAEICRRTGFDNPLDQRESSAEAERATSPVADHSSGEGDAPTDS